MKQHLLGWVNSARFDCGVAPLRWHGLVEQVAQNHAEAMALGAYFDHVDVQGRGVGQRLLDAGFAFRWAGENISAGKARARDVFDWWMSSPPHQQNILKAEFKLTGIGYFYLPSDRNAFHHYWVQVFASGHELDT